MIIGKDILINNECKIDWLPIGKLSEKKKIDISGVYVFIYDSKRIIYVGQAVNPITRRIWQHKNHMLQGGFSIFRTQNRDIYDLMACDKLKEKDSMGLSDYYRKLSETGEVWLPGYSKKQKLWDPLYPNKHFVPYWQEYIREEYISKIDVYVAQLKKDKEILHTLESQIQSLIRAERFIGYYFSHPQFSWIGKQEITDKKKLYRFKFYFDNFPNIDEYNINDLYRENFINKSEGSTLSN
ncbi:MAG: hypothetical protein ABSG15_15395 [FCB group bacterium]|jgi:hypothetical protein